MWHGIALSELNEIAQSINAGIGVKVDDNGLLLFFYKSGRGRTVYESQCDLGTDGKLEILSTEYRPGQTWDPALEFAKRVNYTYFDS